MTAETIEEVIKSRDKALARASEQDGFRRYWKNKADTMLRKFDAAQAHAWGLEKKIAELEATQQPRPMADAPPNGVPILGHHVSFGHFTIRRIGDSMKFDDLHGEVHSDAVFAGWLPLPDQSEVEK